MSSPIDVTAIDHLYLAVADLERSERFYDPVMELLGFKKGTKAIAGEPHVHYFNRVTQISLRPARGDAANDRYRPGALHHLCLQVESAAAVDRAQRELVELGVEASEPAFYDYRPDYYATFFDDPDGTRLEIVCDTDLRRTLRERWSELEGFVDPVSRIGPTRPRTPEVRNLEADLPEELPEELVEVLDRGRSARVERIVSHGHASPPGFWYDQEERELVVVIRGAARLELEGGEVRELGPGNWLILDPHLRHRVAWTDPDRETVWLAVFYRP